MSFTPRSQEEIDYLSNLETITFVICNDASERYYILIEESSSKFGPCYLNRLGQICGEFSVSDFIDSYEECINIISKKYNIVSEKETLSIYTPFESRP